MDKPDIRIAELGRVGIAAFGIGVAGIVTATGVDFSWVRRAGGPFGGDITRMAIDGEGNTFITGLFMGQTTFGNDTLDAGTVSPAAFISKLDRNGNWLWSRQSVWTNSSETSYVRASGATVDSAGDVIVTGICHSTVTSNRFVLFGTNVAELRQNEIFVTKYGSDGTCLWACGVGGYDSTYDHDVGVDADRNVYVSGIYQHTNTFMFVKLDRDGNELMRISPESGWLAVRAIKVDPTGFVYLCGALDPPVEIQGVTLTNGAGRQAFVMKFDAAGNLLWARLAGGDTPWISFPDHSWAYDLAIDSRSNLLVCGAVWSTKLFDIQITPQNNYPSSPYLLKLSPEGSNSWLRAFPALGATAIDPGAFGVATDSAENVYLAGRFGDTVQFGGTTLVSAGYQDAFLAKCDSFGSCLWAIQAGGTNSIYHDQAIDIGVGPQGVFAAGVCDSTSSFGSILSTNPPGWGMFVAAIDFPAPLLGISGAGANVTLTWQTFPSGYVLEFTPGPFASEVWATNNSSPVIANGTNYLTIPAAETQQFFRLRRL